MALRPANNFLPNIEYRVSLFVFLALLVFCSCGSPNDPRPPQPIVPQTIGDLAARQAGGAVVLTFTLPSKSTEGLLLEAPPELEIFRAFVPAGAAPPTKAEALKQIYTLPSAVVDTYLRQGRMEFSDPISPADLTRHAGEQAVYIVRARASTRRASDDSKVAAVRIFPVPSAPADLRAGITETAVELRWTESARTTAGTPITALGGYRIYRAEVEPGAEAAAAADPGKARLRAPLVLLGVAPSASYRDVQFEFGHTYFYTVRTVAQVQAESVESADSAPVVVTPRDVFPPAAPRDLVVVLVPATPEAPAHLELSWGINLETDLAGYNVYRSETPDTPANRNGRLNKELLLTPTFRDTSVEVGRRYFYRVTAVDRAGNESPPSVAVAETVPPAGPARQPAGGR